MGLHILLNCHITPRHLPFCFSPLRLSVLLTIGYWIIFSLCVDWRINIYVLPFARPSIPHICHPWPFHGSDWTQALHSMVQYAWSDEAPSRSSCILRWRWAHLFVYDVAIAKQSMVDILVMVVLQHGGDYFLVATFAYIMDSSHSHLFYLAQDPWTTGDRVAHDKWAQPGVFTNNVEYDGVCVIATY